MFECCSNPVTREHQIQVEPQRQIRPAANPLARGLSLASRSSVSVDLSVSKPQGSTVVYEASESRYQLFKLQRQLLRVEEERTQLETGLAKRMLAVESQYEALRQKYIQREQELKELMQLVGNCLFKE